MHLDHFEERKAGVAYVCGDITRDWACTTAYSWKILRRSKYNKNRARVWLNERKMQRGRPCMWANKLKKIEVGQDQWKSNLHDIALIE
jgi:hypothetical protein